MSETRMWISFNMTTEALLADAKIRTRRGWKSVHAARFHTGDLVDAYDKRPQWGGRKIAVIELLADPKKMRYCDVSHDDWIMEGLDWIARRKMKVGKETPGELWARWRSSDTACWVITFKVVEKVMAVEEETGG